MKGQREDVNFLARSEHRVWVLARLQNNGAVSWRDLRADSEASRPTLQRNLKALENRGWIRVDAPRDYVLTLAGDAVIDSFSDLMATMGATDQLDPFLEYVHNERFDLDVGLLSDADVTVADSHDPHAPVNALVDAMTSAGSFQVLVPSVDLQPMRAALECDLDDDEHQQVVVAPSVAEALQANPSYQDVLSDLRSSSDSEILVATTEIPYYVGRTGDDVQIGAQNDDGIVKALVESSELGVREWADRKFDQFHPARDAVAPIDREPEPTHLIDGQ